MAIEEGRPLRPQLHQLEDKITDALDEVCDAPAVSQLNTGEMIRIEESLAIAADAAKEAVSLRRRLRQDSNEAARNRPDEELGAPGS
jgi:hypothetical protein